MIDSGFVGELLGTMIMVAIGIGNGAGLGLKKTYSRTSNNWLLVCFAWGLAISMGVYTASAAGSAGHLNPAVTIAFAICGLFPWHSVLPYLAGQFIGAFLGAIIVIIIYYKNFQITNADEGNNVSIFGSEPSIKSPIHDFIAEAGATFAFVLVLTHLGDFTVGLKPFIVGMLIIAIGLGLGNITFAMNPARDFAPRLAYTILPVPHKGNADWKYAWVPFFGPIVGAILGAGLSTLV
ncbi:MIP/aquaporin family protein [Lentilactobacillus laojiaonis]|uniref:MIP/aquaporin family protein n=1 Tax=Lentilactobacillus laojiaonis TaxID=2883998 RepID=UPI001D0A4DEC|nr:MIP/aquaporin family protein [Lentilactobacillus laojiaonis]UDM31787.1 aquaporin family protein [Lentilactobacillus laojiaonis]